MEIFQPSQLEMDKIRVELVASAGRELITTLPHHLPVYLSGIVSRVNDSGATFKGFVANSMDEIINTVNTRKRDNRCFLNGLYVLMCQASGDHYLNLASISDQYSHIGYSRTFFSYARMFSARMGNNNLAYTFESLHYNIKTCHTVLSKYRKMKKSGELVVNENHLTGIGELTVEYRRIQSYIDSLEEQVKASMESRN